MVGVGAIASFLGIVGLAIFGAAAAPLFEDQSHPGKLTAVGSTCRVRIAPTATRLGDAYVIDGPSARSIIRIEADDSSAPMQKNDVVLIIDFDNERDAFVVSEIEPGLATSVSP